MGFPAFVHNVMVRRRLNRDSSAVQSDYAAWLWRRSGEIAGGSSLGAVAKRIRFLYSGWKHQDIVERFLGNRQDHMLGRLINERPDILNILVAPYQSTNWSVRTRLNKLHAHYQTMEELDWLFDPLSEQEVELCRVPDIHPELRLVLDDAIWFADEGPLVFNLFLAETRIFSLAFALRFEQDALVAHVGAVQGRNSVELPEVKEIYRELTHAAFGMRPRDLLIETFQLACQHLGVGRILLVSSDNQQRRDALFAVTRHEVHANYDAIWIERGASRLDKSTFELPLHARHRDAADIPSRKRRQYERRYAMLDAASEGLATTLCARRGDGSTFFKKGRELADKSA
jgi:uncharacterized protein VirK/YbjX